MCPQSQRAPGRHPALRRGERSPSCAAGVLPNSREWQPLPERSQPPWLISVLTLDSASLPLSGLPGKSRAPAACIAWLRRVMQPLIPAIIPRSCRYPSLLSPSLAPAVVPCSCHHPLIPAVTPHPCRHPSLLPGCSVGTLRSDRDEPLAYGLVINLPRT